MLTNRMSLRAAGLLFGTVCLLQAQTSASGLVADTSADDKTPPPVTCPAGAPIGPVELQVQSPKGADKLPFQNINHLSEGDTVLYAPILHLHEKRPGEVAMVMVPLKRSAERESLIVTDPKAADKPQRWSIPETISLAAFVYGPQGLSKKKVRGFLSQDDLLIAQLADYAEKTAQTEALIEALENSGSSSASVNAALSGFASQYGLSVQLDKTAPPANQAQALFATINPQLATYNPLASSTAQRVGQTASLATVAATLFFGSPIGLAAGGTAMLLDLRAIAFPGTEFRSSFAQPLRETGVNLCGQRTPVPAHTRVAYIWATRIPNTAVPEIRIGKASFIPLNHKTAVPVEVPDPQWKYLQRARKWTLTPAGQSKPGTPVKILKLGNQKALEIDLIKAPIAAGSYHLNGFWDWSPFQAKGEVNVRPLSDFKTARLEPLSQDKLVTKSGKMAATLEGSDYEFVNKVEFQKFGDEFATAEPVRFILPKGLREGPQTTMDVQIDTGTLDPGKYVLLISQEDDKHYDVPLEILPQLPSFENLPILVNQGEAEQHYELKGERLNLLTKLDTPDATLTLGPESPQGTERNVTIQLKGNPQPGTTLPVQAYLGDRTEPLKMADALQITGPLPVIASSKLSVPIGGQISLLTNEFPASSILTALLDVKNMDSRSTLQLACTDNVGPHSSLHIGEQTATASLNQLSQDQLFLSFDTSPLPAGCSLQAVIDNGRNGRSQPYTLAHIVRFPQIDSFGLAAQDATAQSAPGQTYTVTGRNLELIEALGWQAANPVAVTGLPTPIPGQGQTEELNAMLPAPPAPHSMLLVWLRGQKAPRSTTVTSPVTESADKKGVTGAASPASTLNSVERSNDSLKTPETKPPSSPVPAPPPR